MLPGNIPDPIQVNSGLQEIRIALRDRTNAKRLAAGLPAIQVVESAVNTIVDAQALPTGSIGPKNGGAHPDMGQIQGGGDGEEALVSEEVLVGGITPPLPVVPSEGGESGRGLSIHEGPDIELEEDGVLGLLRVDHLQSEFLLRRPSNKNVQRIDRNLLRKVGGSKWKDSTRIGVNGVGISMMLYFRGFFHDINFHNDKSYLLFKNSNGEYYLTSGNYKEQKKLKLYPIDILPDTPQEGSLSGKRKPYKIRGGMMVGINDISEYV